MVDRLILVPLSARVEEGSYVSNLVVQWKYDGATIDQDRWRLRNRAPPAPPYWFLNLVAAQIPHLTGWWPRGKFPLLVDQI